LSAWLPFRHAITALTIATVRGERVNPETAAATLAPLAKTITQLQDGLKAAKAAKPAKGAVSGSTEQNEATPTANASIPTAYQALQASEAATELSNRLKRWFENYNGFMPEFGWWVREPYDGAQKALEAYAKYLKEEIAGVKGKDEDPLLGKAIGAESLCRRLDHEFIPYSPEELIALAEREFAWCEGQMKQASREMGLGDDWKAAMARVKQDYVKPGEQDTFVRSEARRAIAFVKDHDLVTVPPDCEECWGTRMLAPSAQRSMPYAAYGGGDVLLAYANESMSQEDKLMAMRGNNRPFTRNVIPHELIPGHHLQLYMAARERPHRGAFSTPFFVEGWALYWEMRLWELKYQSTPEDRIGALFWRMHRCARIIVTLKFHLGKMTPEEMVSFLVDRVGHEKFGATSEVRRYISGAGPLYQAGYMLGGLQLIALHKELVTSGQMTEKQFHDAVLTLGPIPVELIRASLLKQPLKADFKTQWKFDAGGEK